MRHVVTEDCRVILATSDFLSQDPHIPAFLHSEPNRNATAATWNRTQLHCVPPLRRVCYKVRFPKICLNCTSDTRPPNEEDCHLPDINNESSPLFLAFRTKAIGRLWANCVREAMACCQYMLKTPQRTEGVYCNRTWDGLTCYEDTDVNRNVSKVCPRVLYIYSKPHCESFDALAQWWCKLLSVLNRYFMVSQYTWMLCEGYYLHRLVAQAFSKQMNLKLCYIFGWGLPAVLVIIYSILRATQSDDRCWRNVMVYDYAFTGPILTCLAVNIFFMIHVIYILVTKLRQRNVSDTENFRKILRAVVILIPVFGVHFVLTTFVSPASCTAYLKKLYAEWSIVGLQGFFVSLIFCYLNGEIQSLMKRSYSRYKNDRSISRRHRPSMPQTTTTTMTATTPM
ncbi:hypothetical protein HPB51_023924 [Rhipicephalus microplus]|uniref:Adenylate cyclase-coupled calcitonin receptor n=1 Tax=Rhipicephalus microplus TaxID=6941 RepID=A0A9J6DDM1_RHIMP|nr:hypothetical protein HPB51_023924 [Rhipicephalus microplus]